MTYGNGSKLAYLRSKGGLLVKMRFSRSYLSYRFTNFTFLETFYAFVASKRSEKVSAERLRCINDNNNFNIINDEYETNNADGYVNDVDNVFR